jgi:hypothetical protein
VVEFRETGGGEAAHLLHAHVLFLHLVAKEAMVEVSEQSIGTH